MQPQRSLFAVPGVPQVLRITLRHHPDILDVHYTVGLVCEPSKGHPDVMSDLAYMPTALHFVGDSVSAAVDAFIFGESKDGPRRAYLARTRAHEVRQRLVDPGS